MSLWNAFSTCWPPGQDGCVVWWDAWAAMGTMIGVLIALLAPLIRQWRNARRLNAIIALRFADELALARAALVVLARSYPTTDSAVRLTTARKLIESEKYRAEFVGTAEKIARLGEAALDFGQLPLSGSLKLTLEVARAVFAAKAVSGTAIDLMKPGSEQSVEKLAQALETYQREHGDAVICVATAMTWCSKATAAYNPRKTGR
ncbi:hypothetical protein ACLMOV_02390 [Stenotrophomonas muris]|uniref:hypothetical protein n=1 Tax=Stenotrophomonas muris TaxID=2963283 RepID=UPI0039E49272